MGSNDGKTFTREDVDNVVESRLAKERKKAPPKEELDAFRTRQAEQKKNQPEDQQMAELQRQHDEALVKLQAYQDREAVMLKGVLPEFAEFAVYSSTKTGNR
ncbi:MAG: hypothetical protein GX260_03570 [Tissierellia bacterium]|nr:hypothetical protein [Bacillota bacterium]NLL22841.1 hypothetical protein [Tissierellia bacterium]